MIFGVFFVLDISFAKIIMWQLKTLREAYNELLQNFI